MALSNIVISDFEKIVSFLLRNVLGLVLVIETEPRLANLKLNVAEHQIVIDTSHFTVLHLLIKLRECKNLNSLTC